MSASQLSFRERKRIAQRRWGKASFRPHEGYEGFLQRRARLNNFVGDFATSHPCSTTIDKWELPKESLSFSMPRDILKIKWIDTEDELKLASTEISKAVVIGVDCEMDMEQSFLGMICIIQISTVHCDYLLDCFKLQNEIFHYLSPIFKSTRIVKLFHSGNDMPLLQRDFQLFTAGVVDLQEVYCLLVPEKLTISLGERVRELINSEVDKTAQLADWCCRPLHKELLAYAAKDAYYLLKSWEVFCSKLADRLRDFDFPRSRKESKKLYRFPVQSCSTKTWQATINMLSGDLRKIFDTEDNYRVFEEVFEWRLQVAKDWDKPARCILTDADLAMLGRARPKSEKSLSILFKQSEKWPSSNKKLLLDLFQRVDQKEWIEIPILPSDEEHNVAVVAIEPPVQIPPLTTTARKQRREVIVLPTLLEEDCLEIYASESEFSEDEAMEITSTSEKQQSVRVAPSNLNLLPTFSERNRRRMRINLKINRRIRNQERIKNGEAPVIYKRNRGKASRLKNKVRSKNTDKGLR
jgi:ribonuclease D